VHKTTGVERPRSRLNVREQQRLDNDLKNEQAYSISCEKEFVLPEYIETGLGKVEVELKTKLGTSAVKTGASPLAVSVGVLVFGLFALCTGYFLWRRGQEEKEDSCKGTQSIHPTDSDILDLDDSYNDELRQYKMELSLKKEGSKGQFASFDDSTIPSMFSKPSRKGQDYGDSFLQQSACDGTFAGSIAASYASHDVVPRVVRMGPDEDATEEMKSRSSRELFKMTVGARSDRSFYSSSASRRSSGGRSSLSARHLDSVSEARSRNAIPKISSVDYMDSMEYTRSSDSSSSSSSSSSSDSSSS